MRGNVQPQAIDARYFSRDEAAIYLRTTPGTLAVWTSQGRVPAIRPRGPKGHCRKILYDRADLDTFLAAAKS